MSLWSRIPLIIKGSYGKAVRAVNTAEAALVRGAQVRSRVRTGNMRGGWQSHNEGLEGIVFNLVDYTIHNEYGTIHMSAQPMLRPAIEEVEPEFKAEVGRIYS